MIRRRYLGTNSININNYLTVEALSNNLSVTCTRDIEFAIDGRGWQTLLANTNSPAIKRGQTISFKAKYTPIAGVGVCNFSINQPCNLLGNIMSILIGDNMTPYTFHRLFSGCKTIRSVRMLKLPAMKLANYCYAKMFEGCTSLVDTPKLPATTLSASCYTNMFEGCTSLVDIPELPATKLESGCYSSMFNGCTSLVNAPELPATMLASSCYSSMFQGCRSLTTAPELPATTLAVMCYSHMFYNCTSLTGAPELPATTLIGSCYNGMFEGCTSLTIAPELPATTLSNSCYNIMFKNCTKLNYIKMLATDISASYCLTDWVYGVSRTGTFVKNPAMTTLPISTSGIPSGWTIQNA